MADGRVELPPLVRAMLRPGFYPHRPSRVRLVQTHASWVFLAGELVYKVKKPVDFGFLDFSTPAKRRRDCLREVALNRRLAPGVYLRVAAIRERGGAFGLAPPGRTATMQNGSYRFVCSGSSRWFHGASERRHRLLGTTFRSGYSTLR